MTSSRRDRCQWCGGLPVPGSVCPWSIKCPTCGVAAGRRCQRPSGHRAAKMHATRYTATEAQDTANGITYPERTPRP